MERRTGTRKHISVSAYVTWPGRRIRCRASDISTTGVFVEMEGLPVLPGTAVQVVFVLARGEVVKLHRVSAVVARVSREGAGMRLYAN